MISLAPDSLLSFELPSNHLPNIFSWRANLLWNLTRLGWNGSFPPFEPLPCQFSSFQYMPLLFPLKFWQPRSHSKALYPLYPVRQQTLTLLSPKYTPNLLNVVKRLLPCFLSFSSKICFPHHCEKNLLETRMISLSSIRWVTSHFFRVNFKFLTTAYMVLFNLWTPSPIAHDIMRGTFQEGACNSDQGGRECFLKFMIIFKTIYACVLVTVFP